MRYPDYLEQPIELPPFVPVERRIPDDGIDDVAAAVRSELKRILPESGIRAGQVYGASVNFLERHQESLSKMPVACFLVCLTMKEDTEENRCTVEAYLDPVREKVPQVQPVSVGLFAGAMDYKKLPLPLRLIMKGMKAPEGDFRDWEAIRTWVDQVRPALLGE